MNQVILLFSLSALFGLNAADNPFAGRWDITVKTPAGSYPDWMEVTGDDRNPKVRVQQRTGSVHAADAARLEKGHLMLKVGAADWDVTAEGKVLKGAIARGGKETGRIEGVPAPELKRSEPKAWSAPESLFDGKDLAGWEPDNAAKNHWVARDGVLLNETGGANLATTRKFQDFRLHIEFNCPEAGNSGIYLRGRYEVQVEYEPLGTEDKLHSMGSIYGMVAPAMELPRQAGEWEYFDITLAGRYVTIVRNGVKTIDRQEIPGITGGALDANEAEPGPFYLQGDHTGGMKYRNITIRTPQR